MAHTRSRLTMATTMALAITGMLTSSAFAATPAAAPTDASLAQAPVVFGAAAWGSTAKTNPRIVGSGRTALAELGCTRRVGLDRTNEAAGVNLPDLAVVGAVTSEATTTHPGDAYVSRGHSTVADVSLLGGDVVVQGIETVARAGMDSNGFHANVVTTIGSLSINGTPVELTGPEQVIDIPGVATLTIDHEEKSTSAHQASASGTAITLNVLSNGAVVKIGNATATTDDRQIDAQFSGAAYTSRATAGGQVTAGKTAVKHMPCPGTSGQDRSNTTLAGDLGDLGTIGVTTSTVNATATPLPDATVTAEVADVSLDVAGIATIKISGVKAQAHASENGAGEVSTDRGSSTVGSIKIQPVTGPEITIDIPADPNTTVQLPLGLGSIDFMTTTNLHGGRGLRVVALQIHLAPTDSNVTIASASVGIRK